MRARPHRRALVAALLVALLGGPESASALDTPSEPTSVTTPQAQSSSRDSLSASWLLTSNDVVAAGAVDALFAVPDDEKSRYRRLLDDLESIPLRPVSIGPNPRRPDDPEPGVGVVIRLVF